MRLIHDSTAEVGITPIYKPHFYGRGSLLDARAMLRNCLAAVLKK